MNPKPPSDFNGRIKQHVPILMLQAVPTKGPILAVMLAFDPTEEDKELWFQEQEIQNQCDAIEQRHCDTLPLGKSGNESYVDDDDEEDEEEDDNDDEESDEREESDDEEMIDDVDDVVDD